MSWVRVDGNVDCEVSVQNIITDADDRFEITRDITDYSYTNKCSSMGLRLERK